MPKLYYTRTFIVIFLIVLFVYFFVVAIIPRLLVIGKKTPHKIHLAFGFHTNLYHSYRIDTNDESGFGKDIRIIRKIIEVMDSYNRQGINVKAVWDIENLFSLEEMLPRYAPDIINNIKRRINEGQDEVIVMSYNNGMASAMNEKEFRESISRAISNKKKSGIKDIFGKYTAVVRPQEVMVTPGNYSLYKKLGIDAVCVYYSAIPFDSIRVFVKELPMYEAFNPLTYTDTANGEKMTVIPMYNIGDITENRSLSSWLRKIHRKQLRGKISGDVLVFINFDADDPYWYGLNLPSYLTWLPNTRGLNQLIDSVKSLDYVQFTTLKEYLSSHDPVGTITYGQDLADGNFCGYDSWAQKATSHKYWTDLMEDRRIHDSVKTLFSYAGYGNIPVYIKKYLDASFENRLRLLSATHFGMAAPFLAKSRENIAESIIGKMLDNSRKAMEAMEKTIRPLLNRHPAFPPQKNLTFIGKFLSVDQDQEKSKDKPHFITLDLSACRVKAKNFYLLGSDRKIIKPFITGMEYDANGFVKRLSLYLPPEVPFSGMFSIFSGPANILEKRKYTTRADDRTLSNNFIEIKLNEKGAVEGVFSRNKKFLDKGSFRPKITYRVKGKEYEFIPDEFDIRIESKGDTGTASLLIKSQLIVPKAEVIKAGYAEYRLSLVDGLPYLFVNCKIQYPETKMNDTAPVKTVSLLRKFDKGWHETAPMELVLGGKAKKNDPFTVIKRNFLGIDSSYPIDYFRHSGNNRNLASINNHITAGFVAASGDDLGVAVAMDNTVLSNFAFCPMKQKYSRRKGNFTLKLNPFGAYFGSQYYPPTWGNRQGFQASLYTGQQYVSSAPTYNGRYYEFSLLISFFNGKEIPATTKDALVAFSNPPIVLTDTTIKNFKVSKSREGLSPPTGIISGFDNKGDHLLWEKSKGNAVKYVVKIGKSKGNYEISVTTDTTQVTFNNLTEGQTYYAAVSSVSEDNKESSLSPEISFVAGKKIKNGTMSLPILYQIKVILASLRSYID